MNSPFTGGCVCGAIRYECTAQASEITTFKCHCRDCQRLGGGPYAAVVYVPKRTFRIVRGAIRHHTTQSEMAGLHQRGFCADCGSRLTGGENDESIGMTASSLDDPSGFKPQFNMWTSDAQPWDQWESNVPAHEKYPGR
jgi:hypothetical protein